MELDIHDLRRRVLAGEKLDLETGRKVIEALRGGRIASVEAAAKGKSKSAVKDHSAVMADLDKALGL